MSISELFSIAIMQGFNGLSTFCVLLLMALGLAIIFGQMGVINMAHGEFLTVGAYTTYVLSEFSQRFAPWLSDSYFLVSLLFSFVAFTPAGLGFVEASLAVILISFGVDQASAIAIALVFRLFDFWLPVAIGALSLVAVKRSRRMVLAA